MTEWERDAAEAARHMEEWEEVYEYPEEYWREFDLQYAAEAAKVEEKHPEMDQEFPW